MQSVYEQLGFTEKEAAVLKLRSEMMNRLIAEIKKRKLTQSEAARLLGISQPRVSDLMRGRLHLFSADMLITLLSALQLDVRVTVRSRSHAA